MRSYLAVAVGALLLLNAFPAAAPAVVPIYGGGEPDRPGDPAAARTTPAPYWQSQYAFRLFPGFRCDGRPNEDDPNITTSDSEWGARNFPCHREQWRRVFQPLGETPLRASPQERAYRLIIFDQHGVGRQVYRVDASPSGASASKGRNGRELPVSRAAFAHFERLLALANFNAPPEDYAGPSCNPPLVDPWGYVFEAVVDGRYRAIAGFLDDACDLMLPAMIEMGRMAGDRPDA